jgi:putative NIF3 family GTP cyclohydrolase 1 type 2
MINRRKFIVNTTKCAGGLALLSMVPSFVKAGDWDADKQYTVQEVIDLILKEGNLTPKSNTVDTLKSGEPDQIVTGIVTTMFATTAVIKEAVRLNANFIIAHEPTFYNHVDDKDFVKDNPVVEEKAALLLKHKIVVWRFHDYIHSLKPDAILYGVVKKAGWLPYFKGQTALTIPSVSLQQLVQHLKTSLNIAHLRVIGNLKQECKQVTLLPGASGGKRQIGAALAEKPDVLIVGELSEWETAEFIRDSNLQGRKMALIVLGHGVSEEPGMEYLVEWLKPKLDGVKITHIASGDPFIWI